MVSATLMAHAGNPVALGEPQINIPKINLGNVQASSDARVPARMASDGHGARQRQSKSRSRAQWAPPQKAPDAGVFEAEFDPAKSVASSFYLPSEPHSARSSRRSVERPKFTPQHNSLFDRGSTFQR